MEYRYSHIDTFDKCPAKYSAQYRIGLKCLEALKHDNALHVGSSVHLALEHDSIEKGIEYYKSQYPLISNIHINEIIKMEIQLKKVFDMLSPMKYEPIKELHFKNNFWKGTIDLLIPCDDGSYHLIDYKYCNIKNKSKYKESGQLHTYKYFIEKIMGYKISKLFYILIPKTSIYQKKSENIYEFRERLKETLKTLNPEWVEIEYDVNKVLNALEKGLEIHLASEKQEFNKNPSYLCNWCDYKKLCEKGDMTMYELPKNEKKENAIMINPHLWIYGQSYTGKTTFIDSFDNVLFINTDGNYDTLKNPVIKLKNEVEKEGRLTKIIFAWEIFKDILHELQTNDEYSYKILCIDLIEDLYEHCRKYVYDREKIQHEQDQGYGKGYDMVKMEWNSTIKQLKGLGLQIVFLSHSLEKEITFKHGNKITAFAPNVPEKVANVLAGMVSMTGRIIVEDNGRYLDFTKDDYVFGGSRFQINNKIPLNKEAFLKALADSQLDPIVEKSFSEAKKKRASRKKKEEQPKKEETKKLTDEEINTAYEKIKSSEQSEGIENEEKTTRASRTSKKKEEKSSEQAGGIKNEEKTESEKTASEKKPRRIRKSRKKEE